MEIDEALNYFNRFKKTMGEDFIQDCVLCCLESNPETEADLEEIYRKNRNNFISERCKETKYNDVYGKEGELEEKYFVDASTIDYNEGTRLKENNIEASKNLINFNAMAHIAGIRLPLPIKSRKLLRKIQKKGLNNHDEMFLSDDVKNQMKELLKTAKMIDRLRLTITYEYCMDGNTQIKQTGTNSLTALSRMGRRLNIINGKLRDVQHNRFKISMNIKKCFNMSKKGKKNGQ